MDLSYQQNLFVEFYLGQANGNGSKAARLAGYKHPEVAASKLLRLVKVKARVEQRVASAAMPANEVLARLSEHAAADLSDFMTIDSFGQPRIDLTLAKKAKRTRVLKKLKTKTRTIRTDDGDEVEVQTEIELHNPQFALDKLAQYHGLYKTVVQATGESKIAKAIRDAVESIDKED